MQEASSKNERDPNENPIELSLNNDTLFEILQKDMFCTNILAQIEKGNIIEGQLYKVQNKIVEKICD